jgi:hypothetical protein
MTGASQLDQTYHFIIRRFVETGRAPHYTDIAHEFSVSPDDGKHLLHELMAVSLPNWLYPETDQIVSFAPFNNLPTHYRVSVDGEQKWFAQCGLESVALSWLFPGKQVRVDAPCLATGEPLGFAMRDGVFESREPDGICMYVDLPVSKWFGNLPFA